MSERQKLKGNEALKSKDFDEAINYYTKSIQYDPKSFQSFGNRALIHLKKKGRLYFKQNTMPVLQTAIKPSPLMQRIQKLGIVRPKLWQG